VPIVLFLCFIAAVGFGIREHVRLGKLRRKNGTQSQKRNARIALFLGYLCAGFLALFTVWSLRGLWALGELDAAVGSVHTLIAAEESFIKSHPERGYTCSLRELEPLGSVIDEGIRQLARTGHRSGYRFEITGCAKAEEHKPNSNYVLVAIPDDHTAARVCADQSQVLRIDDSLCYRT
jgi:hypothetical protein